MHRMAVEGHIEGQTKQEGRDQLRYHPGRNQMTWPEVGAAHWKDKENNYKRQLQNK